MLKIVYAIAILFISVSNGLCDDWIEFGTNPGDTSHYYYSKRSVEKLGPKASVFTRFSFVKDGKKLGADYMVVFDCERMTFTQSEILSMRKGRPEEVLGNPIMTELAKAVCFGEAATPKKKKKQ